MACVPVALLFLTEEFDMEKAKVMVVENETVVALDILNNLEGWDYAITELVATGGDAVKSAQKNPPDIVLMDMDLNGKLSGREAALKIQAALDIPVIFLTAKMDYRDSDGFAPSEPYKYIAKPFKDRDLQLSIEMALYHHRLKKELREGEQKYRLLADSLGQAFFELDEHGVIIYANASFCSLLKYNRQLVEGLSISEITDKSGSKLLNQMVAGKYKPSKNPATLNLYDKDGAKLSTEVLTRRIENNDSGTPVGGLLVTLDPSWKSGLDRGPVTEAPEELTEEEHVDRMKLDEMNKSLRSILDKREQENKLLRSQVMTNVRELVIPYLKKIRKTDLDLRQGAYIDILEANLEEIVSPFARVLSTREFNLTPSEMQIANLVKKGKSTKYVANLLNLSRRTVESHRRNIRIKLGLKNKKANMRSFLASID
jgi:PAS domain S-box-containing protein